MVMAIQVGLPPPRISSLLSISEKKIICISKVGDRGIHQCAQLGSSWIQNVQLGFPKPKVFTSNRRLNVIVAESVTNLNSDAAGSGAWRSWWDKLRRGEGAGPAGASSCLSDVVWPAAGAFVALAIMGHVDKMIAPKGLTLTIAPFGAVCAVLFATPTAPAAQKYNVFVAQIGCAALGVIALAIFGPGWVARSVAVAASIAFMIRTGSMHAPAAGLPILLIDVPKFHHLHWLYSIFPGAAGCILLFMMQEVVIFLKSNYKF